MMMMIMVTFLRNHNREDTSSMMAEVYGRKEKRDVKTHTCQFYNSQCQKRLTCVKKVEFDSQTVFWQN